MIPPLRTRAHEPTPPTRDRSRDFSYILTSPRIYDALQWHLPASLLSHAAYDCAANDHDLTVALSVSTQVPESALQHTKQILQTSRARLLAEQRPIVSRWTAIGTNLAIRERVRLCSGLAEEFGAAASGARASGAASGDEHS